MMRKIYLAPGEISKRRMVRFLRHNAIQEWVYLGKDYLRLHFWEKSIGSIPRLSVSQILNAKAWGLRQEYIEWIAEMGEPYGDSMLWWTSDLAEKNTAASNFFLNLCYLEVAENIVCCESTSPILIVVEDWALGMTLKKVFCQRGVKCYKIRSDLRWYGLGVAKELVFFVGRWITGLISLTGQLLAARRTSNYHRPIIPDPGRPRVLLHTCVDETCLGKDGRFKDRYFTNLPTWLRSQGYDVITVVWPYNLQRSLGDAFVWFRQNSETFVIPEDYFKLSDYPGAILTIFRQFRVSVQSVVFKGKPISLLLWRERLRQASALRKVRFLLYAQMIQRFKEKGWRLDYYVDMFENMYVEKPVAQAVHKHYPNAIVLGFQHSTIDPFMLIYAVDRHQVQCASSLFPDYIFCNGPFFLTILASNGFPRERLRLGPALRYLYLWSNNKEKTSSSDTKMVVLLTLPLLLDTAAEILFKAVHFLAGLPCNVVVKPHPMMERERLLRVLGMKRLPDFMIWAEGDIAPWLSRAICVVGTATAAIFEAVAAGVPAVIVGREVGLEMNPLAWWQDEVPMFHPYYQSDGIRNTVIEWISLTPEARQKQVAKAQQVILSCFTPWDETLLKDFWPRGEHADL